jgi:glycosyltransferase involved in cell wall biosynthesis
MLASEVSGIPFSFTLHGPGIFFEPYTWHLGTKLDRSAFCATISNFARSQAAIFAQPDTMNRVHIVHCGIEPRRLQAVEHGGVATNLIYVGRLVDLKGLGVLLPALAKLRDRHPDLSLTVVGDGPDRTRFERQADDLGLGDAVRFVGSASQDDVGRLLAESDIFVLPSFAEGVPVVIMEAMGSALPIVSTYVGGITELVEDGVHGYLVPPGSEPELVDRLGDLIEQPDLRNRFGKAGRSRVLEEFDSTIEARRLANAIEAHAAGRSLPVRPEALPAMPSGD